MLATHIQTSLDDQVHTNPAAPSSGVACNNLTRLVDGAIEAETGPIPQSVIDRAHASVSAFFRLTDLLTEMQHEMAVREWDDEKYARIDRAADFRGALFDAIIAYVQESR